MSNDNTSTTPPNEAANRPRRGSVTSQTLTNMFGRPTAPFPGTIAAAAQQAERRRMSITTLGLGTSPNQPSPFLLNARRGSVSTAGSDSVDESAIDDDEGRSAPTTPFVRRMSFGAQALRGARGGGSPGTIGRPPSYTTAPLATIPAGPRSARAVSQSGAVVSESQASTQSKPRTSSDFPLSARSGEGSGFNWPEQLRTRAESASQNPRPSFSAAAGRPAQAVVHERAKSIAEMPAPPVVVAPTPPPRQMNKPDDIQERILKGTFMMD